MHEVKVKGILSAKNGMNIYRKSIQAIYLTRAIRCIILDLI